MTQDACVESAVAGLRDWLVQEALPLWSDAGFDSARGAFVERLDFDGAPLLAAPRRAMVQARQIYVYSHASLLGWRPEGRQLAIGAAHRLIDRFFEADGAPGWVFSIHPNGEVRDDKRDLYTHAFALFGLAWAYKVSPEKRFLSTALATLKILDQLFCAPRGGYYTVLPGEPDRRDQNPHMHLIESMLAWHDATGEARFLARAGEIYAMMAARFFQPELNVLPEYFDGRWTPKAGMEGRVCEPGHHYEWSWLLRVYAARVGKSDELIAPALKAFADRHGADGAGLIVDELLDDGAVHKASRRCWPHTEAIKAEVGAFEAGDASAGARAARVIDRLRQTFLGRPVAGGWIDHIDATGGSLLKFMPASTLYHVFLAAAEADRVWGRQDKAGEQ
jgi:mannose-6-phosphate isomerase